MKKHVNIKVTGRVQGVFFRASTKTKADELQVNGFVRNERDGSVYIEAEAENDVLQKFIQWCKQGPANARVDVCNVIESELKNFKGFEIRR